MRRITKPLELASKYKAWHDKLETDKHPEYNSSGNIHYYSIVANLFWVQNGLCAYTEQLLVDIELIRPDKWKDGTFKKFDFKGQLDHFDSSLKEKNGWLWDNFLMADTDVNTKVKRAYKINLLKPDKEDFDPHYYLSYNVNEAMFYPNIDRNAVEKQQILDDIENLGLNHSSIVLYRKKRLNPLLKEIQYGSKTQDQVREQLYDFFTAYEMAVAQIAS